MENGKHNGTPILVITNDREGRHLTHIVRTLTHDYNGQIHFCGYRADNILWMLKEVQKVKPYAVLIHKPNLHESQHACIELVNALKERNIPVMITDDYRDHDPAFTPLKSRGIACFDAQNDNPVQLANAMGKAVTDKIKNGSVDHGYFVAMFNDESLDESRGSKTEPVLTTRTR